MNGLKLKILGHAMFLKLMGHDMHLMGHTVYLMSHAMNYHSDERF